MDGVSADGRSKVDPLCTAVAALAVGALRAAPDGVEEGLHLVEQGLVAGDQTELEELLAAHLDTRVTVTMAGSDGKGKVVVEFGGLEDLERIYRAMTTGPVADASP